MPMNRVKLMSCFKLNISTGPYGIVLVHNGNLLNAPELKCYLDETGHRHINTDSDSEIMLNILSNELNETGKARVNAEDCFSALERTYGKCQGGWACVAMIAGFGLIGFRDPYGIRPLCYGYRNNEDGSVDYLFASESVALQGFGDPIDVKPGEAVLIEKGHKVPRHHQLVKPKSYSPDIFEFVYFARPDSTIDGISVISAREKMGELLAARVKRELDPKLLEEVDAVIPLPETANVSARVCADRLGKRLREGFIKNRYVFRTFIMPSQKHRRTGVRRKLNAIKSEFAGRTVLLVDDSIVRGTTSHEIVQISRECGAKKVFVASCAPPIT